MVKTILLAEDSFDDEQMLRETLRAAGTPHNVVSVRDGQEVIAYLQGVGDFSDRERFPLPSLLFLDLKMPRRDGFEVLKWVRESGFDGSLNIYVLSGSNEPSDVKRARELGASEYITKPITEQKLKQLFGRWAKGGSRH